MAVYKNISRPGMRPSEPTPVPGKVYVRAAEEDAPPTREEYNALLDDYDALRQAFQDLDARLSETSDKLTEIMSKLDEDIPSILQDIPQAMNYLDVTQILEGFSEEWFEGATYSAEGKRTIASDIISKIKDVANADDYSYLQRVIEA